MFTSGCSGVNDTSKKKTSDIDSLIKISLTENMNDPDSYKADYTKEISDYPLYKLYKHKYRSKNAYNALTLHEDYMIYSKTDKKILVTIPSSIFKSYRAELSLSRPGDVLSTEYSMMGVIISIHLMHLKAKDRDKIIEFSFGPSILPERNYKDMQDRVPDSVATVITLFRYFREQTVDALLDAS